MNLRNKRSLKCKFNSCFHCKQYFDDVSKHVLFHLLFCFICFYGENDFFSLSSRQQLQRHEQIGWNLTLSAPYLENDRFTLRWIRYIFFLLRNIINNIWFCSRFHLTYLHPEAIMILYGVKSHRKVFENINYCRINDLLH